MNTEATLACLAESAKYDVSCASSGASVQRPGQVGNVSRGGICHSWSADGRCISLLKVLLTNRCIYDCAYCVNRRSNDVPRASFTVNQLVDLTMNFYRRNYIEGLFLSSGVERSPDDTMIRMNAVASGLRKQGFGGYIHLKAIPGASAELVRQAGFLADRLSVNIELPSEASLRRLAPQKDRQSVLTPMRWIGDGIAETQAERRARRRPPAFSSAGQSTQMIVGASPESDRHILFLSQNLYDRFQLKRVYYSAYLPVNEDSRLPSLSEAPLLREHRLYQADWLVRFYKYRAEELLDESNPNLDIDLDPKATWALRHPEFFPVEINRASYEELLRIPGLGPRSAKRICGQRRSSVITLDSLKRTGVVLKRAVHFFTLEGHFYGDRSGQPDRIAARLRSRSGKGGGTFQPTLF